MSALSSSEQNLILHAQMSPQNQQCATACIDRLLTKIVCSAMDTVKAQEHQRSASLSWEKYF